MDGGNLMVRDGAPYSASALPGERLLTMRNLATERAGAVAEEIERLRRANGRRARRRVVPQFANRRRDRLSAFAGLKQRAEDWIGRRRGIGRARRECHRDRRDGAILRKSREIGGIIDRLGSG